jgi:hypothetical protein
MAIVAKPHQIFYIIIFSILINMMTGQDSEIICSTPSALRGDTTSF